MKPNSVTTKIVLYTQRPMADGRFSVKIRITHQRIQKFYSVNDDMGKPIKISKSDFEKLWIKGARGNAREMAIYLESVEQFAIQIIRGIENFSFQEFKKIFFGEIDNQDDVIQSLNNRHDTLIKEGRIGTASSFGCTKKSIQKFLGNNKPLPYKAITKDFLEKYEKWMLAQGNSMTTIGFYLRNLRTLLNEYVREGKISTPDYPFGKGRYEIPTGRNVKKALQIGKIREIAAYEPKTTSEFYHRDIWLFGYFCNGINMKDIAHLRYKDINAEAIRFLRAKTARTKKSDPKVIVVPYVDSLRLIVSRWGNFPQYADSFVFPMLNEHMTAEERHKRIQQIVKTTNKYIGRIAKELGIESEVTTYTARHSFATVLKKSGASTEFISESLGHSSLRTTENYLADFEIEEKRKWAEKLI